MINYNSNAEHFINGARPSIVDTKNEMAFVNMRPRNQRDMRDSAKKLQLAFHKMQSRSSQNSSKLITSNFNKHYFEMKHKIKNEERQRVNII